MFTCYIYYRHSWSTPSRSVWENNRGNFSLFPLPLFLSILFFHMIFYSLLFQFYDTNSSSSSLYYELNIYIYLEIFSQRMLKIYKKIHKFMDVLNYFSIHEWKFSNDNIKELLNKMTEEDRENFACDITDIDWDQYFRTYIRGIRMYLIKDPLDTLPKARIKWQRWAKCISPALFFSCWILMMMYIISLLNVCFTDYTGLIKW